MEILGNELGRGSSYEIPKELKKKSRSKFRYKSQLGQVPQEHGDFFLNQ